MDADDRLIIRAKMKVIVEKDDRPLVWGDGTTQRASEVLELIDAAEERVFVVELGPITRTLFQKIISELKSMNARG